MKNLLKIVAVVGMLAFTSGCSTSSQPGLKGGTCDNPQCQCPKPCQCGSNCKCGTNGNSASMDSK